MSEMVKVPGVLGIGGDIGLSIVETLVEQDKLPYDFLFRLATIPDSDERQQAALTDIRAALGFGEESEQAATYLRGDLPNCISMPYGGSLRKILTQLQEDYHTVHELCPGQDYPGTYKEYRAKGTAAYATWGLLVKNIDSDLYGKLRKIVEPGEQRGSFSKRYNYDSFLGRVVIKDTAIVDLYNGDTKSESIGPTRREQILGMLLDNHPEMAETL